MQVIGDLFNLLFFGPVVSLLVFILRVFEASSIPGALGLAIIFLTVIIRFLLWPFMSSQLKSAKKMADLKPHLSELKRKHKDDKAALAQAQMALYKEHGVNPAGGCLPALLQIPIILALYQVIAALFEGGSGVERINNVLYVSAWRLEKVPDPNFLGLNLADKPGDLFFRGEIFVALLVPLLTAGFQLIQSKMMTYQSVKTYPSDSSEEKKEKAEVEDTMAAVQTQMVYMMPLMIGFFSWQFPIGLAVYWNTFTILGIWQQYRISGWGGLAEVFKKLGERLT